MQQEFSSSKTNQAAIKSGAPTLKKNNVLDQHAEQNAIMLFNADKRFSITE